MHPYAHVCREYISWHHLQKPFNNLQQLYILNSIQLTDLHSAH